MAGLVGQLAGAALMMALLGFLGGWLIRKAITVTYAQSLGIAVPIVTVLGGWIYSMGDNLPFLAAWPIYAIGGTIALPFMMLGDIVRKRGNDVADPPRQ